MKKAEDDFIPFTTSELVDSADRRVVDLTDVGFPEIPVLGFSRMVKTTGGSIPHRHEGCMEMTLCVRGSAKFDCDGRVYALLPGKVFVSYPEDVHCLRLNQKGALLYWLFLRLPGRGQGVANLPPDETACLVQAFRRLPKRLFSVSTEVRRAFVELFNAYAEPAKPSAARRLHVRAALILLLTEIARDGHAPRLQKRESGIVRLAERMARAPEQEYPTGRLVAETGLSPNAILARFRAFTGLPPHAYLVRCRIRRAAEMLTRTRRTVTDIAAALGFSSSQHLATRFRAEMGATPVEWRRAHCGETA